MIQYLSDDWLQAANDAVSTNNDLTTAAKAQSLTIDYEVTGAPDGKVTYGIVFNDGTVAIEAGKHKDASASFSLDYPTATEIAKGDLSAQAAFMQGRLKLAGDVTVLVRQYQMIDGLSDALAGLRTDTAF